MREFAAGASSYKRRGFGAADTRFGAADTRFGAADTRFGACSDRVSCVPGIEGGVISKTAAMHSFSTSKNLCTRK